MTPRALATVAPALKPAGPSAQPRMRPARSISFSENIRRILVQRAAPRHDLVEREHDGPSDARDFPSQSIPAGVGRCPAQFPVSFCPSKAPLSSCAIETPQRDVNLADTGSRDVPVVGMREGVHDGFGCLDRSRCRLDVPQRCERLRTARHLIRAVDRIPRFVEPACVRGQQTEPEVRQIVMGSNARSARR